MTQKQKLRYHLVGIKGVGMTALALILKGQGHQVTGSDVSESYVTDDQLKTSKIPINKSFSATNITTALDFVIYSAAYNTSNPEIAKAKELGIKTLTQQETLAIITKDKDLIAVAGVGGKTTTSAMIAHILKKEGSDPSVFIGAGKVNNLEAPGIWGKGKLFVAEADEYANIAGVDNTPKLLLLKPKFAVITNILYDHPDIYKTKRDTLSTFTKFLAKIPSSGQIFLNLDDPVSRSLSRTASVFKAKITTYGYQDGADWQIEDYQMKQGETKLQIRHHSHALNLTLKTLGRHNAANALAASALAYSLGISWETISKALSTFKGVGRRQEFMGKIGSTLFYDDYAHHPSEIKATIQAFKQAFPDMRLWVVFESHTFTRTAALFDDFIRALSLADKVTIMPIFSSARENRSDFNFTKKDLVRELKKLDCDANSMSFDQAPKIISNDIKNNDLILTMGAGLVYKLHPKIQSLL